MGVIEILLILIAVGVIMWVINRFIPLFGPIRFLLNVIVLVLVVIWLLQAFGFITPIINFPKF